MSPGCWRGQENERARIVNCRELLYGGDAEAEHHRQGGGSADSPQGQVGSLLIVPRAGAKPRPATRQRREACTGPGEHAERKPVVGCGGAGGRQEAGHSGD